MKYDTLIFDLDGTLTDPVVGIVRCMNYALTTMDFPPRFEKEITPFIGPPLEVALTALSGSEDPDCVKQLVVAYRERYGELGYAENTVYADIHTMLDRLQAQGVHMGVCTSKFEKYAIKVLKQFDLFDYFQFVNGSQSYTPKSEQLAELLQSGTISSNSLMIGDRAVDLSAARLNGLQGAGVLWGYGNRAELETEKPAFMAESPLQLLDKLLSAGE